VVLKRLYERWFDLPNLNAAGAIHYAAEDERESAAFLNLSAPSFVVPNGINWARFESLPVRGAFRAKYELRDAPVVLFLGRLHPNKGLDLLIPAFECVRKNVHGAKLVIVGPENDAYGDKLRGWVHKRGLNESVLFVGFLDGIDLLEAYVDADVFVLPSYTESFGMTVVEAMACGLPVVISDHVSIHREIVNAGAGVVTPCVVPSIAVAIENLLRDRARAKAMGSAGRRAALEQYTWPPVVKALNREYGMVIANANRSRSLIPPEPAHRDVG
jgi:glycosyltransferase involved in cell wall biosynthesis